jgi:hypothetical protein
MKEFTLPLTKKDMRSFLGVTGYYRQYIKDYAHITAPLTELLKKDKPNHTQLDVLHRPFVDLTQLL